MIEYKEFNTFEQITWDYAQEFSNYLHEYHSLSDDCMEELYNYYSEEGEMPYSFVTGDADTDMYILDRLEEAEDDIRDVLDIYIQLEREKKLAHIEDWHKEKRKGLHD